MPDHLYSANAAIRAVRSILTERPCVVREMPDGTKAVFLGTDIRAIFAESTWPDLIRACMLHRQLKLREAITDLPIHV